VTKYNKIFSGYQPRQVAVWRKNQRFEDHLRPRPQGTEVSTDGDGPRNVGFFAIQKLDAAGGPRIFFRELFFNIHDGTILQQMYALHEQYQTHRRASYGHLILTIRILGE
jgi:hypothetical protein